MSPLIQQRIMIGVATLVVVLLTIVAAVFLARQDRVASATPTATLTPLPATATATPTPPPATPTMTFTPVPPTMTFTPVPATATPLPATPAPATATPAAPTATAIPVKPSNCARTPASWVMYNVERYETWDSLSRRLNLSVFELQQANCLNTNLETGQTIYVPFLPPTPTPTDTVTLTPTSLPTPTPDRLATATLVPLQPKIESISPRVGTLGQEVQVIVKGKNFGLLDEAQIINEGQFKVELRMVEPNNNDIRTLNVVETTRTSTNFEVILPADLPEGCYSLVVINPDGRLDVANRAYTNNAAKFSCVPDATPTLTPTFTPTPLATNTPNPPRVITCSPANGKANQEIELTCTGQNFKSTETQFKVELQMGGTRASLRVLTGGTDTTFKAIVPTGLTVGKYDLIITNPDGRSDIRPILYEVTTP